MDSGHFVYMLCIRVYPYTVNGISVQLPHVITHKADMKQICSDIGNYFPDSYTNEEFFVQRAGPEFR